MRDNVIKPISDSSPVDRFELMRETMRTNLQDAVGPRVKLYFQPPSNLVLTYPCVIYHRTQTQVSRAANRSYLYRDTYTVTYVDADAINKVHEALLEIPYAAHDRRYVADNLYHDVYTIRV